MKSESIHLKKPRRANMFGRPDLAKVYRDAVQLIVDNKLLRICRFIELEDGVKQVTISNLWRIHRHPDKSIRLFEYDLIAKEWRGVSSVDGWPKMPFYPIKATQSLEWTRDILELAIRKALVAAGYNDLPQYLNPITEWVPVNGADGSACDVKPVGKKEMKPYHMGERLVKRYCGKRLNWDNKTNSYPWRDGLMPRDSLYAGGRALRAIFWDHIYEREVLSAMLVIDFNGANLAGYLHYAMHRNEVLRIAQEHRNLLPLLPYINPAQWGRDDLFSRKVWVRDGRKSTILDRAGKYGLRKRSLSALPLSSTEYPVVWKWLLRASPVVIRYWLQGPQGSNSDRSMSLIANVALANPAGKIPVIAYRHLFYNAPEALMRQPVNESTQRLIRLYLEHCAQQWKVIGHQKLKLWLNNSNEAHFLLMLDYLHAEGFARGQPGKHSTWMSLVRHSDDWHRRIAIERLNSQYSGASCLTWESLLPETTIDDIVFTPLTDSKMVAVEGYEQGHCVGGYDRDCDEGIYRVFAVREPDGVRSTLGFTISKRTASWNQHYAAYNQPVSDAAFAAGKQLVQMYSKAIREAKKVKRQESPC